MFDKMKQLLDMQKQAKRMKKELAETEIEVERLSGKIKMILSGEYNIKDLCIDKELLKEENKNLLEDNLKQAINEASSKIKNIMIDKMKTSMGDLNLPGIST
jgi:hypothetical protein